VSAARDPRSTSLARSPGRASGAPGPRAGLGAVADDASWDFRQPSSKVRILAALRRELDAFTATVGVPEAWRAPTACAGWEVRDMVGHLVDATDSYLDGFDAARHGRAVPSAGFADMAAATDAAARAHRDDDRDELLAQLTAQSERLFIEVESLSAEQWTNLVVTDRYAGPLPALAIATGLLGGFAVHHWDVCEGIGRSHCIAADTADLLVPFVFALWGATVDGGRVDEPFAIGIRTSGRNGGDTRVDVDGHGVRFERTTLDDDVTVIELDAATFVLWGYGRVNAGTVHGDGALVPRFRAVFRAI